MAPDRAASKNSMDDCEYAFEGESFRVVCSHSSKLFWQTLLLSPLLLLLLTLMLLLLLLSHSSSRFEYDDLLLLVFAGRLVLAEL